MDDLQVELARRYRSLGLVHAARGVLHDAQAQHSAPPGLLLHELCMLELAAGNTDLSRSLAEELIRRAPGPDALLALGRCQRAGRNLGAARMTLTRLLDSAKTARQRAECHAELAGIAAAEADPAGATAHAAAGFEQLTSVLRVEPNALSPLLPLLLELAE